MSDERQKPGVGKVEFEDRSARRAAPLSEERRAEIWRRMGREDPLSYEWMSLRAEVERLTAALASAAEREQKLKGENEVLRGALQRAEKSATTELGDSPFFECCDVCRAANEAVGDPIYHPPFCPFAVLRESQEGEKL